MHHKKASLFMLKNRLSPTKAKSYVVQFFLQKRTAKYSSECNKRSSTVFSRLPNLMAADKPCSQLQPSLPWPPWLTTYCWLLIVIIFLVGCKAAATSSLLTILIFQKVKRSQNICRFHKNKKITLIRQKKKYLDHLD